MLVLYFRVSLIINFIKINSLSSLREKQNRLRGLIDNPNERLP